MTDVLITFDNVSVSYGSYQALRNVSGIFHAGSLTAVAGPNGAGKSTFLKTIAGLVKPREGKVTIASSLRRKTGYLPQASAVRRDYPLSVWQAACTGLWPEIGDRKFLGRGERQKVFSTLAAVGLEGLEDRSIGALSGGQFQRLLFARLSLQDPALLLLDEPFSSVDAETTAKLMQMMLTWHRAGKTVICVLHDLLLIRKYFPESFLLCGKCLGRGHTHKLFEQKLLSFDLDMAEIVSPDEMKHVYGHDLFDGKKGE